MKAFANLAVGTLVTAVSFAAIATPAAAKVTEASDRGFVVRHLAEVPASLEETWAMLVKPADWWDSAHTWSQSADNLTLEPRAGGCFCETLPAASPAKTTVAKLPARGSVEHMRVIYVERPRALRMSGLLGPLQADAASGVLTIQLKAAEGEGGKTQILLEYTVGGFLRTPVDKMAPAVDGVLGGQLARLAAKLGGAFDAAFAAPVGDGAPAEAPPAPEPAPESAGGSSNPNQMIGR